MVCFPPAMFLFMLVDRSDLIHADGTICSKTLSNLQPLLNGSTKTRKTITKPHRIFTHRIFVKANYFTLIILLATT